MQDGKTPLENCPLDDFYVVIISCGTFICFMESHSNLCFPTAHGASINKEILITTNV